MELIAVILKAPTSAQRFAGAQALLNYGFASYGLAEIQTPGDLSPIPVRLGAEKAVTARLEGETALLTAKEKLGTLETELTMETELSAPVAEGAGGWAASPSPAAGRLWRNSPWWRTGRWPG